MRDADRRWSCLDFQVRRPDDTIRKRILNTDILLARSCVEGSFTLNLKPGIARPVGYTCQEDPLSEDPFQDKVLLCEAGGLADIEYHSFL